MKQPTSNIEQRLTQIAVHFAKSFVRIIYLFFEKKKGVG
jgi:hypothetical protein